MSSPAFHDRCRIHDLKNLMTVVVGATEALAQAEVDGAKRRALADASRHAARRAASLLQQLLTEPEPASLEHADSPEILATTASMAAAVLPAGVRLTVDAPTGSLGTLAARVDLEAALLNLCKNAAEACGPGGEIILSAAPLAPAAAQAVGLGERTVVRFAVRDTGPGMAPQMLARAGEPGFTTKAGGSGLGLASVAAFARSAHGALTLASTPGAGLTVSLDLPCVGAA